MNVKAAYFACSVSASTVTTSTMYMTKCYKDELLYFFEKTLRMKSFLPMYRIMSQKLSNTWRYFQIAVKSSSSV